MKKYLSTVLLILIFFTGLSVLLYPAVSDLWNSRVQSRAVGSYEQIVKELEAQDLADGLSAAEAYNAALGALAFPLDEYDSIAGYEDILNAAGSGMMGYLSIPKIDVQLPVYHGVSEGVLNVAAGHLPGTSLPVGGAGTHAVISGHCGLPRAKLFSDLDRLAVGDTFTVRVLNRLLTYRVDRILVAEPDETEALRIEPGRDYCTLVTCTPYGINTHRLLVRGVRTENDPEAEKTDTGKTEAVRKQDGSGAEERLLKIFLTAVPTLAGLLLTLLSGRRRKEKRRRGQ